MAMGLTPVMRKALLAIQDAEIVPTRSELSRMLGYRSKSAAGRIVDQLVERGYLRRLPRRHQAIEVLRRVPTEAEYFVFDDEAKELRSFAPRKTEATE